jgi:hypothetical protein
MIAKLRPLALAASVFVCLLVSGCPQSPGSICQHMVDSIDAMYMRCGIGTPVILTFDGVHSSDCGHVTRISDGGNMIVHQCIPWTASVDCSTIAIGSDGRPVINPPCDFMMLEGHP